MKSTYIIIFFSLFPLFLVAQQTSVGAWNMHLSYANTNCVVEHNGKVFVGTQSGLFSYDTEDNSLRRFSKLDGLSSMNISALGSDPINNILIIGYQNGNVDLFKNNQTINVPYIQAANILADKSINHIFTDGNQAYLSCPFGLVILSLGNYEIVETCYFVNQGSNAEVFATYVFDDDVNEAADTFLANKIFVGTSQGLYYANKNDNLINPSIWQNNSRIVLGENKNKELIELKDKRVIDLDGFDLKEKGGKRLIIGTDLDYENLNIPWPGINKCNFFEFNVTAYSDPLSTFQNSFTVKTSVPGDIIDLSYNKKSNHVIVIANDNFTEKVVILEGCENTDCEHPNDLKSIFSINNKSINQEFNFSFSASILTTNYNSSGKLFLCDNKLGLVMAEHQNYKINNVEVIRPNGPAGTGSGAIFSNSKNTVLTHGGKNTSWNNSYNYQEISILKNDNWSSSTELINLGIYDAVTICGDNFDKDLFFVGTWNHGLFEFSNNAISEHYTDQNSTLQTISKEGWIRIGGVDKDNNNSLWITNSQAEKPLVKMTNGVWESFTVPGLATSTMIGDIMCTNNNQKWIQLRNEGVMVTKELDGNIVSRNLNTSNGFDSQTVNCFVEDLEGSVWVGTANGLSVCYSTDEIFTNNNYNASHILIETSDGYVEKLFENTNILDICIDGANRKWIGTKNNGVFLVSDDGTEQIKHFTQQNSPLLDNQVYNIGIIDNSGEVFFITGSGVCSYRSNATASSNKFNNVAVFPNPVRENFDGDIAITGLKDNTNVKITDISGNLVFETTSLGGMATWDGKNFNGERVATGVYLFLCVDDSFEESVIKKILIYN